MHACSNACLLSRDRRTSPAEPNCQQPRPSGESESEAAGAAILGRSSKVRGKLSTRIQINSGGVKPQRFVSNQPQPTQPAHPPSSSVSDGPHVCIRRHAIHCAPRPLDCRRRARSSALKPILRLPAATKHDRVLSGVRCRSHRQRDFRVFRYSNGLPVARGRLVRRLDIPRVRAGNMRGAAKLYPAVAGRPVRRRR